MIKVTITECYGDRRTTTLRARTDDIDVAVERAIRKHAPAYGARTRFVRDSGISVGHDALQGTQYGQIGHAAGNGISLDTGRVAIRAEA
jgi:hypothetical protein